MRLTDSASNAFIVHTIRTPDQILEDTCELFTKIFPMKKFLNQLFTSKELEKTEDLKDSIKFHINVSDRSLRGDYYRQQDEIGGEKIRHILRPLPSVL